MAYNHLLVFAQIDKLMSIKPRLTLREMARKLGVGTRTFRNVVKEATGMSFREYQKEKILERGRHLLADEPGILKKQVAASLGYSSPDSFSRLLKRAIGKTPAKTMWDGDLPLPGTWCS